MFRSIMCCSMTLAGLLAVASVCHAQPVIKVRPQPQTVRPEASSSSLEGERKRLNTLEKRLKEKKRGLERERVAIAKKQKEINIYAQSGRGLPASWGIHAQIRAKTARDNNALVERRNNYNQAKRWVDDEYRDLERRRITLEDNAKVR